MKLLQLQRRMARALMQPLTSADRIASGVDAGFIKPNDRLTSLERLEIYSRSYWFRVQDSLYEDFPGLRAVLGERAFHRLARAYLNDFPSRSFTLRNLGARLESWLRRNPGYAGKQHRLALDMVRLEWAHIEAFDSAAENELGPEDLLELGPSFRVRLQPYVRLLDLQYPVDDSRVQVNRALDGREAASSAASKHNLGGLINRVIRLKPNQIFLAVHRVDFTVFYRRLQWKEFRLLRALDRGRTIATAIRYAFENTSAPDGEQRSMVENWFAAWAELGWLCSVRPKKDGVIE